VQKLVNPHLWLLPVLNLYCLQLWNAALNDSIAPPQKGGHQIQALHNSAWLWSAGDSLAGDSYQALEGHKKQRFD